jgi:signal transduction histidine kinase
MRRASPLLDSVAPDEAPDPTEARFEQLLRSITIGAIVVDAAGYIRSLNAAAGVIFDIGSRRAIGRAIIEVIPSVDLDRRVRDALLGNPSRGIIELSGVPDSRILSVTIVPIDGSPGAIVMAADETRLHDFERKRRDFISSVSHELRTPLSSINLMIETLLDRQDDAEARTMFLPRIKNEVDRMVQLVEDMLDVARADSGKMPLRRESLDLSAIAAAAVHNFEQRASRAGVTLQFSGEPRPISGDAHRLTQVVVNLVDNALRHTPAGGEITVTVKRQDALSSLVVRDNGEGIPFRDLPHVFERFYVVDRSLARETGGTGLGLSIVKQIVEAHGGTLAAESELGAGSTFTCLFPVWKVGDLNRAITAG